MGNSVIMQICLDKIDFLPSVIKSIIIINLILTRITSVKDLMNMVHLDALIGGNIMELIMIHLLKDKGSVVLAMLLP